MRAVIQRVKAASVTVDGSIVSSIGKGLVVLVGVSGDARQSDCDYLARKILRLRLWPKEDGTAWRQSVQDLDGEVLLVSQFTLFARTAKSNKPDYRDAMAPGPASELYAALVKKVGQQYDTAKVKDGVFGAMMDVSLVNDGPVTIIVDAPPARVTGKGDANVVDTPTQ